MSFEDAFELLRRESPMQTRIVTSEDEFTSTCAEMEAKGLRLAAVSNSGLPKGSERLTFLPASAFKDPQ